MLLSTMSFGAYELGAFETPPPVGWRTTEFGWVYLHQF